MTFFSPNYYTQMVVMGRKYENYRIYFYHDAIIYNILELMGP
jgi:hypothetical protein